MSKNRDERQERGKIQWQFAGAKMHELENEDLAGPRRNPLHERTKGLLSQKRAGTRSRPAREHDQKQAAEKYSRAKSSSRARAKSWSAKSRSRRQQLLTRGLKLSSKKKKKLRLFWTGELDPAAKQRNEKQIRIENLDDKNRSDLAHELEKDRIQNFGQF
jgi:hypothetical protein